MFDLFHPLILRSPALAVSAAALFFPILVASQEKKDAVPAPKLLVPHYQKERPRFETKVAPTTPVSMEITADRTEMDEKTGIVTFTGNVFVRDDAFDLKADKLIVYSKEKKDKIPSAAPFAKAIATGAMVEITRKGSDGEAQIAKSRKADYNGLTGDIILSGGPPTLRSGGILIAPEKEDATIILRKDGNHKVTDTNRIVIPVKRSGKKAEHSIPLDSDLETLKRGR